MGVKRTGVTVQTPGARSKRASKHPFSVERVPDAKKEVKKAKKNNSDSLFLFTLFSARD